MAKSKWFAYTSENPDSKLNLFCFPYAGGSASVFVQWKKNIGADISVFPVLYPFREARRSERMPETVQELAKSFVDENEELLKSKDFAIFSHCAGAVIAYEVIVFLREKCNIEPKFFVVSGAEPPQYSLNTFEHLKNANDDDFLKYLIDSHFVNADIVNNTGFLTYYIPIIREDFKSLFTYSKTEAEKFNCPIHSFVGKEDAVIDHSKLESWKEYTAVKTEFKVFDGDHYYFTSIPTLICAEIEKIFNGR